MALRLEKLLVLCFFVSCCHCSTFNLTKELNYVSTVLNVTPSDISASCYYQLNELRRNLETPGAASWAFDMIDASSKVHSGMMSLNIGELGHFEQCINTKWTLSGGKKVTGKYCLGHLALKSLTAQERFKGLNKHIQDQVLVQLKSLALNNMAVPENSTIGPTWAGCFPDGCSTADVNKIANRFIQTFVDTSAKIVFDDKYCQTADDVNLDLTTGAIVAIVILSLYFAFLSGCTVYDIVRQRQNIEPLPRLAAFSLYSNIKKIFQITDDPGYMPCLDGMKVLSIMWVVLGHQYSITCSGPIANTAGLIQWADSFRSLFIVSSSMSADTFLVITAFLFTIRYLKRKSENTSPSNIFISYLQHCTRVTLPVAFMVLVSSTLLVHLGSGPRWPSVKTYLQDNCANYWWSTLLFMQNIFNSRNMCIAHSWYLSMDLPLLFVSLLIVFCLYRWNKATVIAVVVGGFLCVAMTFLTVWWNKPSLPNPYGWDVASYIRIYYFWSHTRAPSFFMGILCGNLVYLHDKGNLSTRATTFIKTWAIAIWLVCLAVLLLCMFVGNQNLREPTYDMWRNAIHIAVVRPFWALAICWTIFACVTNTGSISEQINGILSYSPFQILRRFVYSLYLVHVTTMYLISFARKTPVFFSDFDMFQQFWGSLFFSWILAFVWAVSFEYPFINLQKPRTTNPVQPEPTPAEQSTEESVSRESEAVTSREEESDMVPVDLNTEESPVLHPPGEDREGEIEESRL